MIHPPLTTFVSDPCSIFEPSGSPWKAKQDGLEQCGYDYGSKSFPLHIQNTAILTRNQASSRHSEHCKNVNQVSSYSMDGKLHVLGVLGVEKTGF